MSPRYVPVAALTLLAMGVAACSSHTDSLSAKTATPAAATHRDPLKPYQTHPSPYSAQQARLEWLARKPSSSMALGTTQEAPSQAAGAPDEGAD
jgi:hypothetical protein